MQEKTGVGEQIRQQGALCRVRCADNPPAVYVQGLGFHSAEAGPCVALVASAGVSGCSHCYPLTSVALKKRLFSCPKIENTE